jgi:acyl carrier protein
MREGQLTERTHEERLAAIIVEHLCVSVEQVQPEARFVEDLGADSLDLVELPLAYEEEFRISITDDESAAIVTVRDAALLIDRLTAADAAPSA